MLLRPPEPGTRRAARVLRPGIGPSHSTRMIDHHFATVRQERAQRKSAMRFERATGIPRSADHPHMTAIAELYVYARHMP